MHSPTIYHDYHEVQPKPLGSTSLYFQVACSPFLQKSSVIEQFSFSRKTAHKVDFEMKNEIASHLNQQIQNRQDEVAYTRCWVGNTRLTRFLFLQDIVDNRAHFTLLS